jgi:hypothetical protein
VASGGEEKLIQNFSGNLKGKDELGDPGDMGM